MERGRLAEYTRYQFIDFLRERGTSLALIGAIIGWGKLTELRMRFGDGWADSASAGDISFAAIRDLLTQLAFFAALLSVAGIVSNDRKHGYFRLHFAKPISVLRYYAQAFLVSWIGALAVVTLLLGVWALLAAPVPLTGIYKAITLQFWVVGTTGLLMSTLVRWDWVATALIWGGSELLRLIYAREDGPVAWLVRHFTAPTHIIGALRDALFMGRTPDQRNLAWALAYGAICFALALLVLKKRPLAQ